MVREAAKKSFLNGSDIKGGGAKGLAIKKKNIFFLNFILIFLLFKNKKYFTQLFDI